MNERRNKPTFRETLTFTKEIPLWGLITSLIGILGTMLMGAFFGGSIYSKMDTFITTHEKRITQLEYYQQSDHILIKDMKSDIALEKQKNEYQDKELNAVTERVTVLEKKK